MRSETHGTVPVLGRRGALGITGEGGLRLCAPHGEDEITGLHPPSGAVK